MAKADKPRTSEKEVALADVIAALRPLARAQQTRVVAAAIAFFDIDLDAAEHEDDDEG